MIERVVAESLHLSILDAERPKSPKEASTTKSSVLQKGAGKRVAEEDIGELNSKGRKMITGDLNSKGGKMKGKRGRPWMDETEGRVIHTAGKTHWPRQKRNN